MAKKRKITNNRKVANIVKEWSPSKKHLEWYRLWVEECLGPTEIARIEYESGNHVTRAAVCIAVHKVDEWMRSHAIFEIIGHRNRLVSQYEMVQREALKAWRDSIGDVVSKTETIGGEHESETVRTEYSCGNPAYLGKFMEAAKAIREVLGIDAVTKQEITHRHAEEVEGLPTGQGYSSRAEMLRAVRDKVNEMAQRVEYEESKYSGKVIEVPSIEHQPDE